MQRSATSRVIKVFWKHALKYKRAGFLLLASIIALNVVGVVTPLFYKNFFDVLAGSGAKSASEFAPALFKILVVIVSLKGISWGLRRLRGSSSIYFQSRVMSDLTETSFRYLIRHSYRFFTDNFSGSLVRRVTRLSRAFEDIADQVEFSLLPLLITVGGILLVLFRRHFYLGLVLALGAAVFFVLHYFVARWKQKYDLKRAEKDSEATGVLADALTNSVNIKLFSSYRHEESLYHKVVDDLRRWRSFTWGLNEWIDAAQGGLTILIEFVMLYFAIILFQRGELTVGDFALIQVYLLTLFERLWDFGRTLRRIYEGLADAAEMVYILNAPHDIKDAPGARALLVTQGKIEFRNVYFSFRKGRKVFEDFNLVIAPGEKVALVGPSGAGKTTVTKLLFRFFDIDRGEILVDGQNTAHVTQDSLRDQIALVPQEPILFHCTLKENIRYGRPKATDEEVAEAARQAHCHEFINAFPRGYDTFVGERGVKLSGGERQRVAIARAILKNAPILVLDEATSSLDSESEAYIQDALRKLMEGRTTLVIAHRLSTIMQMDRIVVIEGGKVSSSGTHKELLDRGGMYKKLWEIQAGGFLR